MLAQYLSPCPFRVREAVEFHYPFENRRFASLRLERRQFVILKIRDCERHPLDDRTLWQNPDVLRGRFLVLGHDLRKHAWRRFYIDSMFRPTVLDEPLYRFCYVDSVNPFAQPEFFGMTIPESQIEMPFVTERLLRWNHTMAWKRRDSRIVEIKRWH